MIGNFLKYVKNTVIFTSLQGSCKKFNSLFKGNDHVYKYVEGVNVKDLLKNYVGDEMVLEFFLFLVHISRSTCKSLSRSRCVI